MNRTPGKKTSRAPLGRGRSKTGLACRLIGLVLFCVSNGCHILREKPRPYARHKAATIAVEPRRSTLDCPELENLSGLSGYIRCLCIGPGFVMKWRPRYPEDFDEYDEVCGQFDRHTDGIVDLRDFAAMQNDQP